MVQYLWLAGALFALASCGKAEDKKSATTATVAAKEPAKKSGLELFTGTVPAPPAPVDRIKPGMLGEEARATAPDVFAANYGYKLPGYNDVEIKVIFQDKSERVQETKIDLAEPLEIVKADLAKKWGEPRARKDTNGADVYYWDRPASGVRAMLEGRLSHSVIHFREVMSVAQLLGTTPGRFGFETTPLLGANKEAVMKAYGPREPSARTDDAESLFFTLPPLEMSEYGGSVDVRFKDDVATGYTVMTSFAWDPEAEAKLLAGLAKLYGTPALEGRYLEFPGPPKVRVDTERKDRLLIWVADYKK